MTTFDDYDAVIIGASFAGLAAASQLQGSGRVLVADRQRPGAGETSACGTVLAVLERLEGLDALEQVHPTITINAAGRHIRFQSTYPFATFDYRTLCEILARRLDGVDVAVAPFGGRDADGALRLGDRLVRGKLLIDASGWRAVLAREYGAPPPDPDRRSVGMELRHGHGGCDFQFWARPDDCPDGVFWAFPAGGHVREGVASYTGRGGSLRSALGRFVHEQEFAPRAVHGGVFPSRLRDPVVGPVFVVGDAAGQCLPLTGEGIRPALVWGQEAGRHAARVVRGEISLDAGLAAYRAAVFAHRWRYSTLEHLQGGLLRLPRGLLPAAVRIFASGPLARVAQRHYWDVADPDRLEVAPGVRSSERVTPAQCATGPAAAARAATASSWRDHDPSSTPAAEHDGTCGCDTCSQTATATADHGACDAA